MYYYSIEDILALCEDAMTLVEQKTLEAYRTVTNGLLPIGMKLFCVHDKGHFDRLFRALGRHCRSSLRDEAFWQSPVENLNGYRLQTRQWCFVLPPVGNARAARVLLSALEAKTGVTLFGNENYEVQLCAPGKLQDEDAALLAIAFYASSDSVRVFVQDQLHTTFAHSSASSACGIRPVLHGIPAYSTFDRRFAWWHETNAGNQPYIAPTLPWSEGSDRTDLLAGTISPGDIDRFNVISTLLVHRLYHGFWITEGSEFRERMKAILADLQLSHWLQLPWVHKRTTPLTAEDDIAVLDALTELSAVLQDELRSYKRLRTARGRNMWHRRTLLGRTTRLVQYYQEVMQQGSLGHAQLR